MVEEYDVNLQPSDKAEDMPLTEETAGAASEMTTRWNATFTVWTKMESFPIIFR